MTTPQEDSLFRTDRATRIDEADDPERALLSLLARELADDGFRVVDVRDRALLVSAGKHNLMIGVRTCE